MLSLLPKTGHELLVSRLRGVTALNYGLDKVRFVEPVRAGSRVRNRIKILAVESKHKGTALVTVENTVELEGAKRPALVAVTLMMLVAPPA
jgi:acyl dehydratase